MTEPEHPDRERLVVDLDDPAAAPDGRMVVDVDTARSAKEPVSSRRTPVRIDGADLAAGWPTAALGTLTALAAVLAVAVLLGMTLAIAATGDPADAVAGGVAGAFLLVLAVGGDASVVVERPPGLEADVIIGYDLDLLAWPWVLLFASLLAVSMAGAMRRSRTAGQALLVPIRHAVCAAVAVLALGQVGNTDHRLWEASVTSELSARGAATWAAVVALASGLIVLARTGRLAEVLPVPGWLRRRSTVTALRIGFSTGVLFVLALGAVATAVTMSGAEDGRERLTVGVLAPTVLGNLGGTAAPIALGGTSEVDARRGIPGVESEDADDPQQVSVSDYALEPDDRDGTTPLALPVLLIAPLFLGWRARRLLDEALPTNYSELSWGVLAFAAAFAASVGLAAALASLDASAYAADLVDRVVLLGRLTTSTNVGSAVLRAAVTALVVVGAIGWWWGRRNRLAWPARSAKPPRIETRRSF